MEKLTDLETHQDLALFLPQAEMEALVLGRGGVHQQVELKLWPKEQTGLPQSARALKETMSKVQL